jgi:hypothetical protein
MAADASFKAPMRWDDVDAAAFAGIHLTGGHAKGMRQYLESKTLQVNGRAICWLILRYTSCTLVQKVIVDFVNANKQARNVIPLWCYGWHLNRVPCCMQVAAICHGVLLLARSIDPATGLSVIHDRQVTTLYRGLER